jgi:hypothetical protein
MQIDKVLEKMIVTIIDANKNLDGSYNWFGLKSDIEHLVQSKLHQLETKVRGKLFANEELKIMLVDYQSLISITKRFPRTVVGNDKARFELDYSDSIRENILKKLESQLKGNQ